MIIKKQRRIEFVCKCAIAFEENELKNAILWYSDKPVTQIKTISLYGKYPAVSIYDKKIHVHRLLMMYWLKCDLDTNEYVHHKDGHRENCLQENLEIVSASRYQRLANIGRKQNPIHVMKRINATSKTRYGHIIYENPELVKGA